MKNINESTQFKCFTNKISINNLEIWILGYIPYNKIPGAKYKKGEYHWGDYYEFLKLEIEKSKDKPNLIVLDKKGFYSFIQDCIINNFKIKTLVI